MKKYNSILPLIFLAIMFGFGIYAFSLYTKLENAKLELTKKQIEIDTLQSKNNAFVALMQNSISESSSAQTNTIFDSVKSVNTEITKLTNPSKYNQAVQLEKDGFTALKNNQFEVALVKFTQAEKILPSYNMVYEIGKTLRKNKANFNNKEYQKKIIDTILKKYSWGAPKILVNEIKQQNIEVSIKPVPDKTAIQSGQIKEIKGTQINTFTPVVKDPKADTKVPTVKDQQIINPVKNLYKADSTPIKKLPPKVILPTGIKPVSSKTIVNPVLKN